MISLENLQTPSKVTKTKTTKSDTPSSTTSFEDLLKGNMQKGWSISKDGIVSLEDTDNLSTQKELLTLLQTDDTKEDEDITSLLALLKDSKTEENSNTKETLKLPFSLNTDISKTLTTDELKQLIVKAKQYLKNKITTNPDFKNLDLKEMPKTLKGLVAVAKELHIDVSKITYETIKNDPNSTSDDNTQEILDGDMLLDELKKNTKTKTQKTTIQNGSQEQESTYQDRLLKAKESENFEKIKNTPIIKETQKTTNDAVLTTKQFIETKSLQETNKQTKTKKPDTLQTLLSAQKDSTGEKNSLLFDPKSFNEQKQTPQQANLFDTLQQTEEKTSKKEEFNSFESLLKGDIKSDDATMIQTEKTNALEVKMQEAKQMMRYLSQDIKKAIDDYKPPFTRVKVTLNPQKLGELDMTVVQRGNNVHINLSSNNAALNILSSNLNELKAQLNQNGINNASFNFNSQGQQESRQDQRRQKQAQTYASNEIDDEFSETINSLEIIIPKYI
jgi:flagellar hook-length control protein FliK